MDFLLKPQEGISYGFVLSVYLAASLGCCVLYILEKLFHLEQIKGFWIVLFPFLPCLVWAFFIRQKYLKDSAVKKNE